MTRHGLLTLAFMLMATLVFFAAGDPGAQPAVGAVETTTPTDTPLPPTATSTPTLTPTATATPTTTATPTPTSTPAAATVAITLSANTAGCSEQVQVTVSARTASDQPVPDGMAVTLSTNLGSISPTSGTTFGGGLFATYTVPATSGGTATISVTVGSVSASTEVAVSCPIKPAVLGFPAATCAGVPPSAASVAFTWQAPAGASTQWLDLSLFDNGFAAGTVLGAGPLSPDANSLVWSGLRPGLPHYWRINALTPQGLVASTTGAFVPCGGPSLRTPTYTCTGAGRASVTFRWAAGSPAGNQWLDLSLFNNGFLPSTFLGAGPLFPAAQEVTWPGILANTVHFYRVNALIWGWNPSETGTFVAFC